MARRATAGAWDIVICCFELGCHFQCCKEYGIEEYYVPEGKGKNAEHLVGKGLQAEISISSSGNAVLVKLYYNNMDLFYVDTKKQ